MGRQLARTPIGLASANKPALLASHTADPQGTPGGLLLQLRSHAGLLCMQEDVLHSHTVLGHRLRPHQLPQLCPSHASNLNSVMCLHAYCCSACCLHGHCCSMHCLHGRCCCACCQHGHCCSSLYLQQCPCMMCLQPCLHVVRLSCFCAGMCSSMCGCLVLSMTLSSQRSLIDLR